MKLFNIVVVTFKRLEGYKQLKGFADIKINDALTIRGIRLLEDSNGFWIGPPQSKYEIKGKSRYSDIIEFSVELKKQIQDAIVAAFKNNK